MAKTLITQEFRGSIVVVEGGKRLAGITIVDTFEVTDEDGDAHKKTVPREADAEELALLLGAETATLRTANATLHGQNSDLQAQLDDERKARAEEKRALTDLAAQQRAALVAVANADQSWDNGVRKSVIEALDAGGA